MARRANGVVPAPWCSTAQADSIIGREAQVVLTIPGTTKLTLDMEPVSVQCPGSLFEQAAFLFLETTVPMLFKRRLGHDHVKMLSRHTDLE